MEKILIKKREPINRSEKRKFEKELLWLKSWNDNVVIPLEIEFYENLKVAGLDLQAFKLVEYKDIYDRYLNKYLSARDRTNHVRLKFEFIDINMYYFENLYKPLENIKK